jgi:C1A family cysteine protease
MEKFGYKVDPVSSKDYDIKNLLGKVSSQLNGDVDLSVFCTDTNQHKVSSCAGNASADSIEIITAINEEETALKEGRTPKQIPQLSRLFVYSMARTLNGDLNKDEGTYLRLCFEVLSKFGICEESDWPHDENSVFLSPSIKAQRKAKSNKIHSYYRISASGESRLDEIVSSLRSKHPVVFGTLIDRDFQRNPVSPAKPPKNHIGGHAMIVVGYIDGKFKIKNSWGPGWCESGYCMMEPEYLAWDGTTDLWVPTLGIHL